jgi:predicted dehydrogenase
MLNTNPSRRNFMKVAGIVSAGVSVGSLAPAVHAQGSDVIKVGLVGCGNRGMGSLMDRFKIGDAMKVVALGDVDQAKATRSMEELLKAEDKKAQVDLSPDRVFGGFDSYKHVTELADVVFIASPAGFHPDHYLYAVEKGKHVFVEKPMCVDPEGFRRCMKANKIAYSNVIEKSSFGPHRFI